MATEKKLSPLEKKLTRLGKIVAKRRVKDDLSLRRAGDEVDVSFNVLARLEGGKLPTVESFVKVLLWLPETRTHMKAIMNVLDAADTD